MASRKTTALTLQPSVTDKGWRMLFLQQIRCCFIHIIVTALFLHKFYFNVSINLDLWTGPSAFVENWKERKETECGKNVRIHLIMLKLHTPSISPSSPPFTSLTLLIWALSSSLCSFGHKVYIFFPHLKKNQTYPYLHLSFIHCLKIPITKHPPRLYPSMSLNRAFVLPVIVRSPQWEVVKANQFLVGGGENVQAGEALQVGMCCRLWWSLEMSGLEQQQIETTPNQIFKVSVKL